MEDSGLNATPEYEGIKNMEQELSQHHLTYIYQDSHDVRPKWYNVGLCLLLEPSTLNAIGKDFHTCEDRYYQCLKQWLKRDSRVKSMKVFIAALRNKIVREENLANKLEIRYATQGPLTDAEREVLEKSKSLRKQFYEIEDKAIEVATQNWDVEHFCELLSHFRFKYRNNHIKFIQEEIPRFVNTKMVEEIFSYLDLYWSYLSTDLLKYILKELKDDESLQKLERLNEDVAEFRRITPLHVFWKVEDVDPASKPIPNENLHQLITKHDPEYLSGRSTLEDVEQFRKEFANIFTLDKLALCVSKISPGSVQVFWSIPPSVAPLLLTDMQKHPEKLKRLGLISATVDSTSVYTNMKFTPMNILQAVQEVKDIEHLGRSLGVPDSTGNRIRQRLQSDAKQREEFVNYFIEHDPEASWRSVIRALDWMGEKEWADTIRHLAEPVLDPTLTMQNLCLVMESVEDWYKLGYYDAGLGVPDHVRAEIKSNPTYKTEEEKKEALLLYYLHTVPMASWQHVAGALHRREEVTALKAVNEFLQSTPAELSLTSHNLSTVLDSMEDGLWYEFGFHVNIPDSHREKIRSKYSSDKDCKQAAIDYLISSHPALSWRLVANALYQMVHNSSHDALVKQQKLFPTGEKHKKVDSLPEQMDTSDQLIKLAEKTVQITNEEQYIMWEEYGLRLHVPQNALPEDYSQCQLKIGVLESGSFELPEDGVLVSAVYSFTHDLGDRELRHPITLEMQHCASDHVLDHLCVLKATSATYKFEIVPESVFPNNDCYSVIKLHHFCWYTTFLKYIPSSIFPSPVGYCAKVYYTKFLQLPLSFQFEVFVYRNLNYIDQAIRAKIVEDQEGGFEGGYSSKIEFDQDRMCLEIPEDVCGWKMNGLNQLMVCKEDVDSYPSGGRQLIPCLVQVDWRGSGQPTNFYLGVRFRGAKQDSYRLIVTLPNSIRGHAAAEVRGESQETSSVASVQSNPTTGEQPSLPELLHLKILQEVGANYSIFGIFLLNDQNGSRVKALKQACQGNPEDVMLSILQEWLQGKGLPVTWDSLVQTLRDSDLLVLADKIQASKMPAGERGREEGDHS